MKVKKPDYPKPVVLDPRPATAAPVPPKPARGGSTPRTHTGRRSKRPLSY